MFNKNNEPIIIKNSNFKKCILFICFPIKDYKDEELQILKNVVFDRSKKYDTKRKIAIECINNCCLSYRSDISYIGNNAFLEFSLSYPSIDSLKKDVLLDNLLFIKEMIFNPYLQGDAFPEHLVLESIEMYKERTKNVYKNCGNYYKYKNELLIDEDDYLISPTFKDLSLLDKVTGKSLYNIYNNIINNPPLIFLIGNVEEEKTKSLIKEVILNNKISNIKFKTDYHVYAKNISNSVKLVNENSSFSSSGVYCNYKVKNMSCYRDEVLLSIVKNLLSSNNSKILFNYLRNDNDLVYNTSANNYRFGVLTLSAFTSSKNIDKVFELYQKAMNYISDINYIENKLPLLVEKARIDDELDKENLSSILFNHVDKYLGYINQKYYDVIKSIKPLEVKEFIDNRLVMVSKYIGVGEENG